MNNTVLDGSHTCCAKAPLLSHPPLDAKVLAAIGDESSLSPELYGLFRSSLFRNARQRTLLTLQRPFRRTRLLLAHLPIQIKSRVQVLPMAELRQNASSTGAIPGLPHT